MWNSGYWARRYWAARQWAPVGLTAPGNYWCNYFSRSYWNTSYWNKQSDSAPLTVSVSSGLASSTGVTFGSATVSSTAAITATVTSGLIAAASIGLNATPTYENGDQFTVASPLEMPTVATAISLAATVVLGFTASAGTGFYWAGRFWAAGYWAPRYWQTQAEFSATVTAGLSVASSVTQAASVAQEIGVVALTTLEPATGVALACEVIQPSAVPLQTAPGHVVQSGWKRRRNYIVKGKKYYDLTEVELAGLVAREHVETRADVKVAIKDKKPHLVSKEAWEAIKPKADDDEAIELLML